MKILLVLLIALNKYVDHPSILKIKEYFNEPSQGRRNGFQSGEAKEYWKVLSVTMVGRQENFLNSRRSRMAKIVTF